MIRPVFSHMRARERFAWSVVAAVAISGRITPAQAPDRRQLERVEQALRQEGQAILELANTAANDRLPADFTLTWHHDFLKAQTGTFIPFIVGIAARESRPSAVLLYVRAARQRIDAGDERRPGRLRRGSTGGELAPYPFEEIYPVDLPVDKAVPFRLIRGFSLAPGDYDVTVVARERDRREERGRRPAAAVLRQTLRVPDYSGTELTTSTVMLADGLTVLAESPPAVDQARRPYVIGVRDILPAADAIFSRSEELIVVFLVYNPSVTTGKHFDLEVEYHFFRKSSPGSRGEAPPASVPRGLVALDGERYFNRTEPQRFNPTVLGASFDPAAGQPVMAGQGVPLAGFQNGEYRLAIRVKDLVSGRTIERDVTFTVRS
jgi:hypothetical protein